MEVKCHDCGKIEDRWTKDELIDLGWSGANGAVNGHAFKYELCPKCYSPERHVEIIKEQTGI